MKVNDIDYKMLADLLETDPNHKIFNSLATNADRSYHFAYYLIKKNLEVPEIILKSIETNADRSYYFANKLMNKNLEVPEIIKQKSKEFRDDLFTENYFERIYNEVLI